MDKRVSEDKHVFGICGLLARVNVTSCSQLVALVENYRMLFGLSKKLHSVQSYDNLNLTSSVRPPPEGSTSGHRHSVGNEARQTNFRSITGKDFKKIQ